MESIFVVNLDVDYEPVRRGLFRTIVKKRKFLVRSDGEELILFLKYEIPKRFYTTCRNLSIFAFKNSALMCELETVAGEFFYKSEKENVIIRLAKNGHIIGCLTDYGLDLALEDKSTWSSSITNFISDGKVLITAKTIPHEHNKRFSAYYVENSSDLNNLTITVLLVLMDLQLTVRVDP